MNDEDKPDSIFLIIRTINETIYDIKYHILMKK